MSVLIVGSTALDSIKTPKAENPRLLGGSASYNNDQVSLSGGGDNTHFLVSASHIEQGTVLPGSFGDSKKFDDSLSASDKKKMAELSAASVDSVQTNLFAFNPKESYAPDEWIKADSYWKPKAAAPAVKPAP